MSPFRGPYEAPPPPPRHVVDHWRFPAPAEEELVAVMADKDLAYLARLALLRGAPEARVLASLLLRLFEERRCA